jgi:diguanylate cyclase (GGDEF)-like protein
VKRNQARRVRKSRDITLLAVLAVVAIGIAVSVAGTVVLDAMDERATTANRDERIVIRRLEVAAATANSRILGYVLTSQPEYLAAYISADKDIEALSGALNPLGKRGGAEEGLTGLRGAWQIAAELVRDNRPGDALTALTTAHARDLSAKLHDNLEAYYRGRATADAARVGLSGTARYTLRAVTMLGVLFGVVLVTTTVRRIRVAIAAGEAAKQQIEQLFVMGDMLQSAVDIDDTNAVLRATALRLLPGLSGAMYVFNNSRDRLDRTTQWGTLLAGEADHIAPSSCWALKRGKPHLNEEGQDALSCAHGQSGLLTLDIPMTARGQLYGLLEIAAEGPNATQRLTAAHPVAAAIGDAMSLALSNAALRDQLRNQALRDGLTSLYNRRFLEEVQERLCLDSERRASDISLIMIDMDRFKVLNDTHGHGAGDTVLREVAAAILSSIRSTDIACRYGGEELLILLPDCPLEMAIGKAEQIRNRVASLTFAGGFTVTASFGVASLPETSASARSLLSDADAALYLSKTNGRDRVSSAPRRLGRVDIPMASANALSSP